VERRAVEGAHSTHMGHIFVVHGVGEDLPTVRLRVEHSGHRHLHQPSPPQLQGSVQEGATEAWPEQARRTSTTPFSRAKRSTCRMILKRSVYQSINQSINQSPCQHYASIHTAFKSCARAWEVHGHTTHLSNSGHRRQRLIAPSHLGFDVTGTGHASPQALVVQQTPVQATALRTN
jgi:hypothetical protein